MIMLQTVYYTENTANINGELCADRQKYVIIRGMPQKMAKKKRSKRKDEGTKNTREMALALRAMVILGRNCWQIWKMKK